MIDRPQSVIEIYNEILHSDLVFRSRLRVRYEKTGLVFVPARHVWHDWNVHIRKMQPILDKFSTRNNKEVCYEPSSIVFNELPNNINDEPYSMPFYILCKLLKNKNRTYQDIADYMNLSRQHFYRLLKISYEHHKKSQGV